MLLVLRKRLWVLLLLFSEGDRLLAESQDADKVKDVAQVTLKVMAKGTGRILKRAEVRIGQETLATGPDGTLQISIPAREGSIQVLRQGFEALFIDFDELRKNSRYDVYLPPGKPDDSEVVITGQRRPETSRKTITVQESRRIAPNGDPAQVAQLLPGVQSNPGRTDVVIRGSGPNDSRYYVDDISVPNIFHQVANLSIVPPQQLSDVDFNSGGFGAQYGDATGGIIVLRSSEQIPEYARSEWTVNVPFYLGLYHERPLSEQSGLSVSVRKSMLEAILPKVLPEEAGVTVVPLFTDAYARYIHRTDDTTYKFTTILSEDGLTLSVPFDNSSNAEGKFDLSFRNRFAVIALEREHNLGGGWRYRATPQFSVSRLNAGFGNDKLIISNQTLAMRTEFSKRLDKGRNLYLGFSPEYSLGDVDIKAPAPSNDPYVDLEDAERLSAKSKFSLNNFSAWSTADLQWGQLIYTPGLRLFKSGFVNEPSLDPRLQMRYAIDSDQILKLAVGQYSIAPEPVENNQNPDLAYEKSNHFVLGVETKWSDRWVSEFQAFYKKTYRLIVAGGEKRYTDSGNLRTYGLEAFIRRNLTEQFFAWLSYTYSVSKERKSEQDPWYLSEYDQTHILNLVGSYKIDAYWDLGLRFKYNTASPYTPVTDAVYNGNLDKYQPRFDVKNPNSERIPAANSLDLFATYDSLYDTYKLKYQFGIQYIAVGKRIDSIQYNFDYSKKEELSRLPPIPYIQISGEF